MIIQKQFQVMKIALGALALALGGSAIFVYGGVYNIAADAPHFTFVARILDVLRDQSIAVRAKSISAPGDLGDAKRIASGAGLYGEMCSGCHLAPGMERTEISQGLYPQAPELGKGSDLSPEQEFWVIKHGIKMTGMAAWGATHNDTLIWDMVAFLQKLPSLSASDYRTATKNAPEEHDDAMQGMDMKHDRSDIKSK
jgi:mono/diheme cytochrome c family protein